jgi:uncharacterized protein (TIGR00730 family)
MDMEVAHEGLNELHVVETMHDRKRLMAELCDGVIALPGGLGTLEELFEMLTWLQLEVHQKPCAIFNASGFYDSLLGFLDELQANRFVSAEHRQMLMCDTDADRLLDAMQSFQAPRIDKWLDRVKQ